MKGPDLTDILGLVITIFGLLFLFFAIAGLVFG